MRPRASCITFASTTACRSRVAPDHLVNVLEYWEIDANGKVQHFSWITDFVLTPDNVYDIMRGGRARWKIENETFNTLKNQGYCLEHNYGHGEQNLSVVLALLMMLVFLVDQTQQLCCPLFQAGPGRRRDQAAPLGRDPQPFSHAGIQLHGGVAHGLGARHRTPEARLAELVVSRR